MKIDVSGGFSIHIKRRRKKDDEVELEPEVFPTGFQPNKEREEKE